jgi:hypothetical protein
MCQYVFECDPYQLLSRSCLVSLLLHLVAEAEARALMYRSRGTDLWFGTEHSQIQVGSGMFCQDKMTPVIAFGTPFKVEVCHINTVTDLAYSPSAQRYRLVCRWVQDGWYVWAETREEVIFSLGVHASVPGKSVGKAYTDLRICMLPDSRVAIWVLQSLRMMSKLIWECQQTVCTLRGLWSQSD